MERAVAVERAKEIIADVGRALINDDDATELIATRLRLIYNEGVGEGLLQAREAITEKADG